MTNGFSDEQFKALEDLMRQVVREEAVNKEELRDELKHLTTREEYYDGQDKIMSELKTVREEQSAHMMLHDEMEKRLQKVERKTGLSSAVS